MGEVKLSIQSHWVLFFQGGQKRVGLPILAKDFRGKEEKIVSAEPPGGIWTKGRINTSDGQSFIPQVCLMEWRRLEIETWEEEEDSLPPIPPT